METTVDTLAWRPQLFSTKRAQKIRDPIVEPLWDGDRVLVHRRTGVRSGSSMPRASAIDQMPEIEEAIAAAAASPRMVLDGYITPQAARSSEGAMLGDVTIPSATQMAGQLFLGRGGELRRNLADQPPPDVKPGDTLVLVCIDLLSIDDEPLLDVPLLERRRILDSAITESDLVRIGVYVRPPIDPWIGSWRSQGFRAMAFKEANSRYRPGTTTDDWATAQIPKR